VRSVLGFIGTAACACVLVCGSTVSAADMQVAPLVQSGADIPAYSTFNGVRYRVTKSEANGQEVTYFSSGGRTFTQEELRRHVRGQEPQIILPAVQQRLDTAAPGETLELMVVLFEQPAAPISRQVMADIADQHEMLTRQIQAVTARTLPSGVMTPDQERAFAATPLSDADMAARRSLSSQLDDLTRSARQQIAAQLRQAVAPSQNELAGVIADLGGEVTARVSTINSLGVTLPADRVAELAAHPLVSVIDLNHPGAPELDNHRHSLGLETGFWANGIDGGVHDVGVLDTGVEQSHPALNSHNFLSNMGTHDSSYHGTGMAGILASTDSTYRGMAYGCDTIVVARAGDINTSMPGMDYIASTGEPENVNYSFGNGRANDVDYGPTDQFFDGVINTFDYMVSKSTGNGGWGVTTITHPAPAYNLMASANMDDRNTITRDDDIITSSSSTGPTKDGRKKPDITSPGTNSMSCNTSGGFSNIGGTSSASPHTGGGIVLLYDMGLTNVMGGKAVLLNTAEAMDDHNTSSDSDDEFVDGSNWNHRFGWGYINLGQAYLHGLDVFLDEVPDAPEHADYKLYTGQMFQYEKATLVWERHVAYNGATFPTQIEDLSDLDLYAYRAGTGNLLAESTSPIDNVEQLHVGQDGLVVLKVEAHGSFDPDIPQEPFALATQENFVAVAPPAFLPELQHTSFVNSGSQFSVKCQVRNTGEVRAHDVSIELSGVTVVSGSNPAILDSLAAGATTTVTWTVQAPGPLGDYDIAAALTSDSYGETISADASSSFEVVDCVGDLNGDGSVGQDDLGILLGAYGNSADGDIDGDGDTDQADLGALLGAYGTDCP
jgi:serine protease AprX